MSATVKILQGDCRAILPTLDAESVQCCVCSPPYWGLRDYGTARWEGGQADCKHVASERYYTENGAGRASSEAFSEAGESNAERVKRARWRESGHCTKCGAIKVDSQIGLEPTPEAYVETMRAVFAEVRRVLKKDGTLWLNLGDSYAGSGPSGASYQSKTTKRRDGMDTDGAFRISKTLGERGLTYAEKKPIPPPGLKSKDLIGIPWRVALALQADGWWLRQDIIWHKPSTMPESVTDRCTKAHEYIFLLTKQDRYYFDNEAIKEPSDYPDDDRKGRSYDHHKSAPTDERNGIRPGNYLDSGRQSYAMRNKRSVWSVTNCGYPGAHFATYPPDLIKPCILAGSKPGDTILDPFGGSGTTGQVALELGRSAILIELNPEYVPLIEQRTAVTPGLPI